MGRLNFGIATYNYPVVDVLELARAAEDFGFSSFWCGEHYVVPDFYASEHPSKLDPKQLAALTPETELYDSWSLFAAIAATTKTLKIGSSITIVPLNNPLILARASMTAHALSGGRILFGIGAGWLREEFDALGIPFEERGSRLDETMEILQKAWAGGFFEHEGKHFRFSSVMILPFATEIPIICGGNSDKALKRAARIGSGWMNSSSIEVDEALHLRDGLEKWRAKLGTSDRAFTYYLRPKDTTPDGIAIFAREGFDHFILPGMSVWPRGSAVSITEKRAGLKKTADLLGVTASLETHRSQ